MLEKIQFINYKCFENATIPLREITIAVGKNNAGKSTMIEGLRLLSLAIKSGSKQSYKDLPSIFQQRNKKSKKLKLDSLKIDLRTVSHFYKEDIISKIIGYFNDKNKIEIYISDDVAYACYYDKSGKNIKSANKFLASSFSRVEILPQIGLIKEEERQLAGSTIVNGRDTYLSSRHFRNEILDEKTKDITVYEEFCQLAEQTWQGLKVKELIAPSRGFTGDSTPPIQLMIEADRFTSEIGYMGSGLQMWLQIIWFICKSAKSETVILDEPDVYMHPDLQRSLVKIVKNRFKQVKVLHSISNMKDENKFNECLNKKIDEYFKDKVADLLASKLKDLNRSWDISRLNSEARRIRDESWNTLDAKLAIIGGKEALKMIRDWFQKEFQTSCSIDDIIKNSRREDFDTEILEVIKSLRK